MTSWKKLPNAFLFIALLAPSFAKGEATWEQEEGSNNKIIRMEVTPADEPSPAFKHRLTLLPHQLVPGNSVAHYMRSFPEGGIEKSLVHIRKKYGEEFDTWYGTALPISKLPLDKVREADKFLESLGFVRAGSRCRETDWGVSYVDVRGPEVFSFLLPEIQAMRGLSRALSLRTRLAIAERRYGDAIDLMRVNYRLGRDVGKQPILVSGLVGIAINGIANNNMTDLIAAPDSPNLYWALSELPRPSVSLRDAIRLELQGAPRFFKLLDSPETQQHTAAEWNALWMREAQLVSEDQIFSSASPDYQAPAAVKFLPAMLGLTGYSHAKERMIAWGFDADKVEAMAVGQVLSIYFARIYQIAANEMEKMAYVSLPERARFIEISKDSLQSNLSSGNHPDREIIQMTLMFLLDISIFKKAEERLLRAINALRVIEALRMHAARNDNQWPAKLTDVTCVPVPNNPATGKPFEYTLEGETAILILPKSDGLQRTQRYELTLAK